MTYGTLLVYKRCPPTPFDINRLTSHAACHGRGREFESRRPRHFFSSSYEKRMVPAVSFPIEFNRSRERIKGPGTHSSGHPENDQASIVAQGARIMLNTSVPFKMAEETSSAEASTAKRLNRGKTLVPKASCLLLWHSRMPSETREQCHRVGRRAIPVRIECPTSGQAEFQIAGFLNLSLAHKERVPVAAFAIITCRAVESSTAKSIATNLMLSRAALIRR